MNLRVLIYMNPLVVDKISKQFIYDKDSGFIFTRQLIASLPSDWRYSILAPPKVPREFFPLDREVHLLPYNYSTSIHQNRYHFNRELLADYSPYSMDYDVIISNQPEITANLDVFFFNQRREKPIILNFFHWIDCKESREYARELGGYIWRQIDGVLAADVSYFHTAYARSLFDKELKRLGVTVDYKFDYFAPQPTVFGNEPMELPDKKIILFNHRNNETTGWREVLKACKALRQKRDDFVLWLTDDQKTDEKEHLENLDFVVVKRVPFENYGYLMKHAHFSVCNLTGYATWNLSVLDSYVNGCFPLMRDIPLLRSLFPDHVPPHSLVGRDLYASASPYFVGETTFGATFLESLTEYMNVLLDIPIKNLQISVSQLPKPLAEDLKVGVGETIINLINDRIANSKLPKKYDDIKRFITDRESFPEFTTKFGVDMKMNTTGFVLKKEWVNYFWSYHVNGNFQKIRWRLLSEGIKDDITQQYTTYFTEKFAQS